MARTLPNLTPSSDFFSTMKSWQQALKSVLSQRQPPSVVLSFSAKGIAGGAQLTWGLSTVNAGVEGFVIQRSDTGDFNSNFIEIPVPNGNQTGYFDVLPAGTTKYYRLIATTGPRNNPSQSRSNPTGVLKATESSGTTAYDTSQTGSPAKVFRTSLFPIAPSQKYNKLRQVQ